MKPSRLTRALTLTGFILLVSGFVIYRGGYLNTWLIRSGTHLQNSPNGGTLSQDQNDSSSIKKPVVLNSDTRLSSSKSLVLIDNIVFNDDYFLNKKDSIRLVGLKWVKNSDPAPLFKSWNSVIDTVNAK